jgi:hypothetical protein
VIACRQQTPTPPPRRSVCEVSLSEWPTAFVPLGQYESRQRCRDWPPSLSAGGCLESSRGRRVPTATTSACVVTPSPAALSRDGGTAQPPSADSAHLILLASLRRRLSLDYTSPATLQPTPAWLPRIKHAARPQRRSSPAHIPCAPEGAPIPAPTPWCAVR